MESQAARKAAKNEANVWKAPVLTKMHRESSEYNDSVSPTSDLSSNHDAYTILSKLTTKAFNIEKQACLAQGTAEEKKQ